MPDGVPVATLLKKTTGALQQQHLRLNARTLQTYGQVRKVILEYHRLQFFMNPVAQTSANAAFQAESQAPMNIGALVAVFVERKAKRIKGNKEKVKDCSKSAGQGNQHWNFGKGKGKGNKGEGTSSTSVCWLGEQLSYL